MQANLPLQLSLDGTWDFFYSPKPFNPLLPSLPKAEQFTGLMVTPGYWDDHYELFDEEDFFGLEARFNPDYRKPHFPMGVTLLPHAASSFLVGTGFYRKMLELPQDDWNQAVLTVVCPMWGCSVFCNRQLAGIATGYSAPVSFDVGGLLNHDGPNELIIVVCNVHDDGGAYHRVDGSHDGEAVGARPGQHRGLAAQGYQSERGGIGGGVSLRLTKKARIDDFFLSSENGNPLWHIELHDANGCRIDWRIDDDGKNIQKGSVVCTADKLSFATDGLPEKWSHDHPFLYDMTVELRDGDETLLDERSLRWAPRTLSHNDTRIFVNGNPVYFCGVTEHCYFAETCNPHFNTQKYLHDLGVLRQAGFNFIRCHTWCPPEPFYDACDQLGIYVQTELPSVWSMPEAEDIIRMVRRHPCAVIFCEGNEKIIDEKAIVRLKRLVDVLHEMAPGMLFNPQEAMRGIEYAFAPGQELVREPMTYDPKRMAAVREFTDVFGALGGEFSYSHDDFPGAAAIDRRHAAYGRPILSHEAGILGGYLDFSLEERYKGTFIGTDLFEAARENMQKHGVYENARQYYELNCRFISSVRKQLMENLRACNTITGFDYLGGIDTHWHLIGYPCGIFNEFYEEKYGESIADVCRYTGDSVLLCSAGKFRNRLAGTHFNERIILSHFGREAISAGRLQWTFEKMDGTYIVEDVCDFADVQPGTLKDIAQLDIALPPWTEAAACILRVTASFNGMQLENEWKFWVFPKVEDVENEKVICTSELTAEALERVANGGALLLTGGFPACSETEVFRTCTSGRSLGHAGTVVHDHPIWKHFPQEGFADWQFYPLMTNSHSLVQDAQMPPFTPILELIPCFKRIRRKSMIAEFAVGKGRMIVCGFNFQKDDPAVRWMKHVLTEYLAGGNYASAPTWDIDELRSRLGIVFTERARRLIDAGGRPVES
jgi:hypothetical protein